MRRQVSMPVDKVLCKEEQTLMKDMLETMYDANGIGSGGNSNRCTKENYSHGYF